MKLDRAEQRALLEQLAVTYPKPTTPELSDDPDHRRLAASLAYLEEHGLVRHIQIEFGVHGTVFDNGYAITAAGLDFLADDGGLSAILGVVTIKLHDDTIKELIAQKVLASQLPEPDKKRFLDQLRELPAETTKHLVLKLVDTGLEAAPQAMALLGKFLTGP